MEKEYLKELGKQLLNIGIAIIVFTIIQPIMKENLTLKSLIYSITAYILITTIGTFLIKVGEKKDEP